ncbi:hypothetical protein ES707_13999 [subsurface metagenome]
MQYPKVKVTVTDPHYEAKVVVYRHVTTPEEITVVISEIRPIPPTPLVNDTDRVSKVIKSGKEAVFGVKKTYPY